jgi:hypothetical protein
LGGSTQDEANVSPATALEAAWLEQAARAEPDYPVGQELENGWTLLGYDTDEERLASGESSDLLLYWQGPDGSSAGSEVNGWYPADGRWLQVVEGGHNLLQAGAFELGLVDQSPTGFPLDIYHHNPDPGTRLLVSDVRAGQNTTVALLDNTEVYSSTSLASVEIPVDPGQLYLQAGWIKSQGGNGYIGRRWSGDLEEGEPTYSYVAAGVRGDSWRHYSGVAQPPAGTTHAQVWLLNFKAPGQVFFDDSVFVEVGPPGGRP